MNNVSLIGRLGQDPELRYTTNANPVVSFTIAVDNPYHDDRPDWIPVQAWGPTAEAVAAHKSKGDQVAITGRVTSSAWEDDDGNKRSRVEITADRVEFLHRTGTITG